MVLMLFKTERAESRRGETQLLARGSEERSVCAYRSEGSSKFSMLDKSMPAEGGAEEGRSWCGRLEVGGGRWEDGEREEVKEKIRAFQSRRRHAVIWCGPCRGPRMTVI